ncbi:hypothetical protein GCM10011514_54810 [Emticicia aquatilis]|uniref:Uncharacterized protein n=2 Tax=Emticicia aquatilis TaxID=1537369 RepID=A0A916ZA84_9BACT|nr:hypothetical protein GCM10011514_54810 [Emticicia aquatilis]
MIDYKDHSYLAPILKFFDQIGIAYQLTQITEPMFLPGIRIQDGILLIDTEHLLYPGDVIYEAGHLAVAPPEVRPKLTDPIKEQLDFDEATHEMMTLAWAYAAAIKSEIPLEVLFHPDGYKGQHLQIMQGYQSGMYIGLPMLQWLGMAYDANNAHQLGEKPFPEMKLWLRPPSIK